MSLNNQSLWLADLGRQEEALAAIEEAVTAYRALAQTRPAVFASWYASWPAGFTATWAHRLSLAIPGFQGLY